MPESRGQWFVFFAGLCAIGVLGVLVGLGIYQHTSTVSSAAPRATGQGATAGDRSVAAASTAAATVSAPLDQSTTSPPARAARSTPRSTVRVLVNASRGDSWIMARSGSATGRLLYQGTLTKGRSLRWSAGRALWIQVGAGANLDARVNGKLVTLLSGTFTALLTPSGLSPAR